MATGEIIPTPSMTLVRTTTTSEWIDSRYPLIIYRYGCVVNISMSILLVLTPTDSTRILTIPVGFRPKDYITGNIYTRGEAKRIEIYSDGGIFVNATLTNVWVYGNFTYLCKFN